MYYGITTLATDFTVEMMSNWRLRIINAIFFFARANPGNEALYPQVRAWALELDEDGWPQREVGLDSAGKPLFGAPNQHNTGFWPDMSAKQFEPSELQEMSELQFNQLWETLRVDA